MIVADVPHEINFEVDVASTDGGNGCDDFEIEANPKNELKGLIILHSFKSSEKSGVDTERVEGDFRVWFSLELIRYRPHTGFIYYSYREQKIQCPNETYRNYCKQWLQGL